MQSSSYDLRRPPSARALYLAASLLGCSASGSPSSTDASSDTEPTTEEDRDDDDDDDGSNSGNTPTSAGNGPATTDAGGGDGSSSTTQAPMPSSTTEPTTDPTADPTTTDGDSDGGCPADAECSGPEDTSCEFGGSCLACTCIGGTPPMHYGDCSQCEPDEEPFDSGEWCVCAALCDIDTDCPAFPGDVGPNVQEPSCVALLPDRCVFWCTAGQDDCPDPEMTCTADANPGGGITGFCVYYDSE